MIIGIAGRYLEAREKLTPSAQWGWATPMIIGIGEPYLEAREKLTLAALRTRLRA